MLLCFNIPYTGFCHTIIENVNIQIHCEVCGRNLNQSTDYYEDGILVCQLHYYIIKYV